MWGGGTWNDISAPPYALGYVVEIGGRATDPDKMGVFEDTTRIFTRSELLGNDTDIDNANSQLHIAGVFATSALGASISLDANGNVVYNASTQAMQSLASGKLYTDTFSYTVTDSAGGESTATVSLTVIGRNDSANITGTQSGAVIEATSNSSGIPSVSGDLLATDVDNASDSFQAVTAAASSANGYGSYTVTSSGVWTYTLSNGHATVDALNNGQTLSDTFVVRSVDGTAKTVSITIQGATDDVTPPSVTSVTYGANDGTLKAGETVTINVAFNENLVVNTANGTPTLSLNSGGTAVYSGVSGNVMTFSYTVAAGENTSDLAVTRFNHHNATVGDAVGNNLYIGDVDWNPGGILAVDGTAPTFYFGRPALDIVFSETDSHTSSHLARIGAYLYDSGTRVASATVTRLSGALFMDAASSHGMGIVSTGGDGSLNYWSSGVSNGHLFLGMDTQTSRYAFSIHDGAGNILNQTWDVTTSISETEIYDIFNRFDYYDYRYSISQEWALVIGPAGVSGKAIQMGLGDPTLDAPDDLITMEISGLPSGWSLNNGLDNGNGLWTVQTSNPAAIQVTTPVDFTGAALLNVNMSWTNADGTTGTLAVHDNVEAYAPGNPIFAWSLDDHLTGSPSNDTFVFGQPIGADKVYNFDAAADQIDLMDFAGFNSFADVQAHLSMDASDNAVLTLADGQTITLVGVDASTLTEANFAFNENPVTNNAGVMSIGDGAMLPLGGIVNNSGSITLDSAGQSTTLQIIANGMTLQGGGTVVMSDSDSNVIAGTTPDISLTNVDNSISGAGQIGGAQLVLNNQGVINANGEHALIIDTGSAEIVNTGSLKSTGNGGLFINSALLNNGALLANGGDITLKGIVTGTGTAAIDGEATIEFVDDASTVIRFTDTAIATLKLDDSAHFTGSVTGWNNDDSLYLLDINGAAASFSYSADTGVLSVTDGANTSNIALVGQYDAAQFSLSTDATTGGVVAHVL
jgi:VCBS repeat-containing protein